MVDRKVTAEDAVREYLNLGVHLLSDNPAVSESDRDAAIEHLAHFAVESCFLDACSLEAFGAPYHLRQLDHARVAMLLWTAPDDPISWKACEILAAGYLDSGASMPENLRDFTARLLRDRISPPKTPAAFKRYFRDQMIAGAVSAAQRAEPGLPMFRNHVKVTRSACDIVAQALEPHGIFVSAGAIKKVVDRVTQLA